MSNEPAQPHQQQSIIEGESAKYFEFGIAVIEQILVGEGGFAWELIVNRKNF